MSTFPKPDYPLIFNPILKDKVWGGKKLKEVLDKENASDQCGESWELSGVAGNISIVAQGSLKGIDLNSLIAQYPEQLLGKRVHQQYGQEFPLLFKFIDAADDLSVQVHPDDSYAQVHHQCFGKTEMWYVMQADPEAELIVDFKNSIEKLAYQKALDSGQVASLLKRDQVSQGDSFFIAPGTIHAIGKGVLLAEIQQTSDITYRVYDWDRPDQNGAFRELHNDRAVEVLNFEGKKDQKIAYLDTLNQVNTLYESDFFATQFIPLRGTLTRDVTYLDSFLVYMCVEGEAKIEVNGHTQSLKKGQTCLVAAYHDQVQLEATNAQLLEVYVP